jgi:hypothetical protein
MKYFNSQQVASIAMLAALWGVLNSILAPAVFQILGLPILCDMVGFAVLVFTVWWVRKLGAATAVGLIATVVNFLFNPYGLHFLGFTVASSVFDLSAGFIGFGRCFEKPLFTSVSMFSAAVGSAAVAGLVIGSFFMAAPSLALWGGVLGWAGLHATGGVIGGSIGIALVTGLSARGLRGMSTEN